MADEKKDIDRKDTLQFLYSSGNMGKLRDRRSRRAQTCQREETPCSGHERQGNHLQRFQRS